MSSCRPGRRWSGLAFALPVAALALRERSASRARATLGLQRPSGGQPLARVAVLVALAALVAVTAAQPARRVTSSTAVRSDAELYLTFDVSRSMLAASAPGGRARFDRARALGRTVLAGIGDVPIGVATLTNRMMPLLFPTGDGRSVSSVIDHSLQIMQPPPVPYTTARESSLSALGLAADRSYFDPTARKRALVVFTDLDSDAFSLAGTLRILRRHRIEPFVVRVARQGESVFDASGRPYAYRSISTVTVAGLRVRTGTRSRSGMRCSSSRQFGITSARARSAGAASSSRSRTSPPTRRSRHSCSSAAPRARTRRRDPGALTTTCSGDEGIDQPVDIYGGRPVDRREDRQVALHLLEDARAADDGDAKPTARDRPEPALRPDRPAGQASLRGEDRDELLRQPQRAAVAPDDGTFLLAELRLPVGEPAREGLVIAGAPPLRLDVDAPVASRTERRRITFGGNAVVAAGAGAPIRQAPRATTMMRAPGPRRSY